MDKPRIRVDFNELLEQDLVLLSKTDEAEDSDGNRVKLKDGLPVAIFEFNHYDDDEKEYLLADGIAVLNTFQNKPVAKWCCRIDGIGITVSIK